MNDSKKCKDCGLNKVLDDFHDHKGMKDGKLNSCRDCRSQYDTIYRSRNRKRILSRRKSYDRGYRGSGKAAEANRRYREKYPNAYIARGYYHRNKDNILVPDNCEKCGSDQRLEAHHSDYNKPLDVIFLCVDCHNEWHISNTPAHRESGIFTEKKK